eukprot:TRINITY_DN1278_c0_g1_i7.p1 TRINITY_DN1278_c0_g1~~TRINITY_DN1278_c0_g1_i7.p1  ORF type:complete len:630 (-),score=155.29 TRINITY_DN1278_c0_g1_i7:108-1997(-)
MFDLWDVDKNGTLSLEEMKRYIEVTSSLSDEVVEDLVEQVIGSEKLNEKVEISFEDFKKVLLKQMTVIGPGETNAEKNYPFIVGLLGEKRYYSKGEKVFVEDTDKSDFHLVLQGNLELSHKGEVFSSISVLVEEQYIGEDTLFDRNSGRYCTATVTSDTLTTVCINSDDLMPLILHSYPRALRILKDLGKVLIERLALVESILISQQAGKDTLMTFLKHKNALMSGWSLHYHQIGSPGKIAITPTKELGSTADLSVAYSPGVAEPCLAIKEDPDAAYKYTSKGNLVGVISNGTAVLGLGNIGALASKPVMEGKAVLFKKLGKLDSFDIEINQNNPDKLIEAIVSLEPTFGGMNLEDIKAPECFHIEKEVQKRVDIPIMHDDQHGTAIIAGAGLLNALKLVGKNIEDIKVVVCGVGAAGFTCARYFIKLGVNPEYLTAVDVNGVVHVGRKDLEGPNAYLKEVARDTDMRTLREAIVGADVFLGVSAANLLDPSYLESMNRDPLVFALANPIPEISYNVATRTRKDVIMATGRSDFPNQINNVCAFPYIFRGAMDSQATEINEDMKFAASMAIADLARQGTDSDRFGRDYIIPKPFDTRLYRNVSLAVAKAAMESGVARKQLDLDTYLKQQ